MSDPFFLVGPTAVGKTELAVDLAERLGAEIVGADAFQVYQGLDQLSAKPTLEQRQRVPHHLVGSVPLSERYSVARYLCEARRCLEDIAARGKKALVVGGSGMYVKALTHGLAQLPEAQPELRQELERLTTGELLRRLEPIDSVAAAQIDSGNKRRLVRALEVCLVTGRPFSALQAEWQVGSRTKPCGIFLSRSRAELVERIERRATTLLAEEVLLEIKGLEPASLLETSARMLGLVEIRALLAGETNAQKCRQAIAVRTRQYAKRQITWFKREACFVPLNLGDFSANAGCSMVFKEADRFFEPGLWQ